MNDRELLELAAKAAGFIEFTWRTEIGPRARKVDGVASDWNPLADDGDALRLAVKLSIHVLRFESMATAIQCLRGFGCDERDDGDPYAATRRAIVRAAAEIGRARG